MTYILGFKPIPIFPYYVIFFSQLFELLTSFFCQFSNTHKPSQLSIAVVLKPVYIQSYTTGVARLFLLADQIQKLRIAAGRKESSAGLRLATSVI
jgi:hypothetical protein